MDICLVLLHGFCESKAVYDRVLPHLTNIPQYFCIDLPGFGSEPFMPTLHNLDDYATWVGWKLDHANVEKIVIAGHSLGGYIAAAFAEKYPDRVAGIGMIHSTALEDSPERKANRDKSLTFIQTQGKDAFLKVFVPSLFHQPCETWTKELWNIARGTSLDGMLALTRIMRDRPDRTQVLMDLQAPVYYLSGQEDLLIPIERTTMELAEVMPEEHLVLPQVGHMSMWEAPQAVAKWLDALYAASVKNSKG